MHCKEEFLNRMSAFLFWPQIKYMEPILGTKISPPLVRAMLEMTNKTACDTISHQKFGDV